MKTELTTISANVTAMNDMETIAAAWIEVINAKSMLKEIERVMKDRAKEIMTECNIHEIQLNDTIKIILAHKKKDRFDTAAIYKALAFTDEQVLVLPKNPKFRKTAILANDKTSPTHWIEESDVVEAEEIDEKFLPGKAQ